MNAPASQQLPALYRRVAALDRNSHRGLRLLRQPRGMAHAASAQLLPALFEEFPTAARHLPIVFVPGPKQPSPVFLLGAAAGQNAFVDPAGERWIAEYAPAYLRRYPFILGEQPGADPILLFDTEYEGLSESEGEPLFGEDGEPTPVLKEMIRLSDEYRKAALRSDQIVARLQALELFRPISLDLKPADGGQAISMQGLLIVDEQKLQALSDADFLSLRANGVLGALYAHLISLGSISALVRPRAA